MACVVDAFVYEYFPCMDQILKEYIVNSHVFYPFLPWVCGGIWNGIACGVWLWGFVRGGGGSTSHATSPQTPTWQDSMMISIPGKIEYFDGGRATLGVIRLWGHSSTCQRFPYTYLWGLYIGFHFNNVWNNGWEEVCVCGGGGDGCSFHASPSTVYHSFLTFPPPILSPVEPRWTASGGGEAVGVG